jgi:hypothetical protein
LYIKRVEIINKKYRVFFYAPLNSFYIMFFAPPPPPCGHHSTDLLKTGGARPEFQGKQASKKTTGPSSGPGFFILACAVFIFVGCDLFNNSMVGYFLDNTAEVTVTSMEGVTRIVQMINGTILIPPASDEPTTVIGLSVLNPRDLNFRYEISGETALSAGRTISADRSGNTINVEIAGAEEYDEYTLTLAMQSPDGLKDFIPYTMTIRCVSFETALRDFRVNDLHPPLLPDQYAFTVNVSDDTDTVTLAGITVEDDAELYLYEGTDDTGTLLVNGTHTAETPAPLSLVPGANRFYLKVVAPSTNAQGYPVTVYRGANAAGEITAFSITSPVNAVGIINEGTHTIGVTVPYGTDVSSMTAKVIHTGASIDPNPTEARSYAAPVTYTVTAADGSTREYTVTVQAASNTAREITAFSITSPVNAVGIINEGTHTIGVTVPYGTNVGAMTATVIHTGASIDPNPTEARSYASPVTYTVTAANGSTQDYTVTVQVASNTAKEITAFYFTIGAIKYGVEPAAVSGSGIINEVAHTIDVTVPYGTNVGAMTATVIHTGASIGPNPAAAASYASPVIYTVTAADGSHQDYTVTVNVAKIASIGTIIGSLLSPSGFVKNGTDISGAIEAAITTVTGTDSLGTAITLEPADYSVDTIIPDNAGTDVTATLRVPEAKSSTGEDITELFNVYIKSDAKAITAFYFTIGANKYGVEPLAVSGSGSINEGSHTITVTVPYGTNRDSLTAALTHTGVSVTLPSGSVQIGNSAAYTGNFSSAKTFMVTAEDDTSVAYTVTVNVAPGITINGITNPSISVLTFSGVPPSLSAGESITITISGEVSGWYVELSGPGAPSTYTAGAASSITFTTPATSGFYNVNVIATVGAIDYSGSFVLILQ